MIKNYFKIAFRNLVRGKVFTIINILGLTLGITACFIIYLVISFELSYDKFHPDKDRIYRVVSLFQGNAGEENYSSAVPLPMATTIKNDFTGIESVAQFHIFYTRVAIPNGNNEPKRFFGANEKEESPDVVITGPEYFDIFKYQWLAGNAASMKKPFQVVLTENKAQKYFGSIPAAEIIGREIIYEDSLHLFVSGIVKDYPKNSDLIFNEFISSETMQYSFLKKKFNFTSWQNWSGYSQTFVKTIKDVEPGQFEQQAATVVKKNMSEVNIRIKFQPLSDIHFNANYQGVYGRQAHLPMLYGLAAIAIFILLIATINFINLSTAQSLRRAKEIGIRKVLGSKRTGLVFQFMSETLMLTIMSVVLSLIIIPPVISAFHSFLPDGVTLTVALPSLIFILLITILTSLLAGLYPAKVLSSYLPAHSLKGVVFQPGSRKNYLRKSLIVFQFTISLIFIISTLVIGKQLHFAVDSDMGFTKDAIINIPTNRNYSKEKKEILAKQIKQIRGVEIVSLDMGTPAQNNHWITNLKCKELGEDEIASQFQTGDENYVPLYKLKLVAGRNLLPSDTMKEYLINETCAKKLGFKNPENALGKFLEASMSDGVDHKQLPIVGVIVDFHSQSMHELIASTFISTSKQFSSVISVKLSAQGKRVNDFKQTITEIERFWKGIYPNEQLEYSFFDETVARFYNNEQKTEQIMSVAMGIAIFISCMGLFGLATFIIQQRTKEIGIRKVMGASLTGIVSMLSIDFLKLVFLALIVASPVAWYFMHNWLQDFAYRISIPWWVFVIAGVAAALIAFIMISFQAIKAAIANPIKSLRTE